MSEQARAALLDIGTNRQGSAPAPRTPESVLKELRELGLIGKGDGLTRKGSVKRQLMSDEQLDALFG